MPRNETRARNAIIWIEIFRLTGVHSLSGPIPKDKPANPAFTMSNKIMQTEAAAQAANSGLNFTGFRRNGGADRDRTDDLKLAKLALSQLSYGPEWGMGVNWRSLWWARDELNVRPHAYQACALTT